MKLRTSFVANSSSCSYVCHICQEEMIGEDYLSYWQQDLLLCPVCNNCYCMKHASQEVMSMFDAFRAIYGSAGAEGLDKIDRLSLNIPCPHCERTAKKEQHND